MNPISYKTLRYNLIFKGWKTPNSYGGKEYQELPNEEGVYALISIHSESMESEILYIGRSDNLKNRHVSHPVKRFLKLSLGNHFLQTWFMTCGNSRELEKMLIQENEPKFNTHYNNG